MLIIDTYKNNKKMYICINQLYGGNDSKNNFYVTHSVSGGEKTLYTILKDGFLRPGKDIKHANILSTGQLEHVYGNINFCDLNNIDNIGNVSLQFSSKLLFDFGIIFALC